MKNFGAVLTASTALLAAALASPPVKRQSNTPPVTIKGNAFWQGNKRFYIRGVDYQPGGSGAKLDPIADVAGCTRDIARFKELGINTIRIYMVDNTLSHDTCMKLLSDAGIYLALDVNSPDYSINRDDPRPSYNDVYLQNVFAIIDSFAKYDNTLLFFSANEVVNDNKTTPAIRYVKAVTRDMKQYIKSQRYRQIPVGYSAADIEENRYDLANYMNCGSAAERSDFFAFNDYSWCDPSTFQQAKWDQKVEKLKGYSIPIFLSEYGCITNTRQFNEVASIYSTDMSSVYSGGLVYEYTQEPSGYGLVTLEGGEVTPLPGFNLLKAAFANQPDPSGDGGYLANGQPSQCPAQSATWALTSDKLPALPVPAQKLLTQGAGTGVGLQGSGSQYAGTPSADDAGVNTAPGGSSDSGDESAASSLVSTGTFGTLMLTLAASLATSLLL